MEVSKWQKRKVKRKDARRKQLKRKSKHLMVLNHQKAIDA
jgi:hypothetical protein